MKECKSALDLAVTTVVTPRLLCGESLPYDGTYPKICDDCKRLWKKLKEDHNERQE